MEKSPQRTLDLCSENGGENPALLIPRLVLSIPIHPKIDIISSCLLTLQNCCEIQMKFYYNQYYLKLVYSREKKS